MKRLRLLPHVIFTLGLIFPLCGLPLNAQNSQPRSKVQLDGVRIGIAGSFKTGSKMHASPSGDLAQVAYSVAWRPYREISIIAIPFGVKPGSEAVPVAGPGATGDYEEALQAFREGQGGIPLYAPIVEIFGQKAVGISNLVSAKINGPKPKLLSITEWVVEAGERMWILRVSQEVKNQAAAEEAVDNLADLVLTTDETLLRQTTLADPFSVAETAPAILGEELEGQFLAATNDLPFPSWWNGSDCDNNYYQSVSGQSSYRLGGVYRGMPACGPRPLAGGMNVTRSFQDGGTAQIEWQCVELAKRYLYLAYGIPAYSANGSQMVQNYSGSTLQKIYNGTAGSAPQAGDVLSYGSTSSYGHTSVVASSSVPTNGTCTNCIQIIEQNNSASGSASLSINNWTVTGGPYPVSGWLHYSSSTTSPPAKPASSSPGSLSSPGPLQASASVQLSWSSSSNATTYSLGVRDMTTNLLVVDTTTSSTSYTANLNPARTYRWNVAACNSAGCSSYTTPLYFQTPSATIPGMPGNTSPGSLSSPGPVQSSATVQLSWSAVSNATFYSLGVRDMITNQLVVDTTTSSTAYTAYLSPGKRYRWNVAACNAAGCSSFTSPLYFQTP